MDGATGTAPDALLQAPEDTRGYFRPLQGVIQRRGVPLAVSTDRQAVFRQPRPAEVVGAPEPTQFGRALRNGESPPFRPQPRGQRPGERANGIFQGRLVTELRLAGASTLEAATAVLPESLPRFNARFGVPAPSRKRPAGN